MADNKYSCDYAKRLAKCKRCKENLEKGACRLAKITASPFSDDGTMKLYHHPKCMFDSFLKVKATTKIIEEPGDIEGFEDLKDEDKDMIKGLIREFEKNKKAPAPAKGKKAAATPAKAKASPKATPIKKATPSKKATSPKKEASPTESGSPTATNTVEKRPPQGDPDHKDNSFRQFRQLCATISNEPSSNSKTSLFKDFFARGSAKSRFEGDLYVWVRLLLPGVVKRIYNMQSKQMVKVFSRMFGAREDEMLEHLEKGDVADTVAVYFAKDSCKVSPAAKSVLTIHQVDDCLNRLTGLTKEEDQMAELLKISKLCTVNDLKMLVRLIKGDLRIGAGAKPVLEAVHKDAYEAFNSSRNVTAVIDKVLELRAAGTPNAALDVAASLMQPVQPMLAQACKSVDMAFDKCPNGMYAEIKYDGERVQVHKRGSEFKYFSRSLKPVLPHKVSLFKDYIPEAFQDASDLILDAEVLMVDTRTGEPLPFGTLGKHKAAGFSHAQPCLFVFDCIYYDGKNLMTRPIRERRRFLEEHMREVKNRVKFSEYKHITAKHQLGNMIKDVLKKGLEGLVLKDVKSVYEPGKRHWLKVKKDYLNEGAMADTADLVVLGAWYGSGIKGGLMSIFLTGCYDPKAKKWVTVTKVHTGHDDATLDRLQKELGPNMVKIKQDYDSVPDWLRCSRQMVPDFVAKDPKKSAVWEITGAEFTRAELHTADGISIRFPRVTKIRDDKSWDTATNLDELKALFKASKESTDFNIEYSTQGGHKDTKKTIKREVIKEDPDEAPEKENIEKKAVKRSLVVKEEPDEGPHVHSDIAGYKSYEKICIENPESGFKLQVVKGDLFKTDSDVSLAHCISKDCRLGKGIAKIFRDKFGRVDEIEAVGAGIGDVAPLKEGSRYIYNLVTKELYSDQPTYRSLELSLRAMLRHCVAHNVREIAMPKIGCGLDGLQWNAVRTLIKNVFLNEDIRITVYVLAEEWGSLTAPPPKKALRSPAKNGARGVAEGGVGSGSGSSVDIRSMLSQSSKKRKQVTELVEEPTPKRKKRNAGEKEGCSSRLSSASVDGLPDCLEGVKVLLTSGVSGQERLKRYVIAFGGLVLEDFEAGQATHIVYPESVAEDKAAFEQAKADLGVKASKSVRHVRPRWLINSILKKARIAEDDFLIGAH